MILAITNALMYFARLKALTKLLPCLGLSLVCGLFWEYAAVLYLPHSVSDVWDIAAYMSGAAVWWLLCLAHKKISL